MKNETVILSDEFFVGSGYERLAYIHPHDPNKLIKIVRKDRKDK